MESLTNYRQTLEQLSKGISQLVDFKHVKDIRIDNNNLEVVIDRLDAFYEQSEGCHVYVSKKECYTARFYLYGINFALDMDYTDLQDFRELFNYDEYTDLTIRKIESVTVGELIKEARLELKYRVKTKEEACEIMDSFEHFGDYKDNSVDGYNWLIMSDSNLEISVFYGEEEDETQ